MGSVRIERRKSWRRDILRAYKVEIDGRVIGKLRSGQTAVYPLEPGTHEVRMVIDWASSPVVAVSGSEHSRLVCAPGGVSLSTLYDMTFGAGKYVSLVFEDDLSREAGD